MAWLIATTLLSHSYIRVICARVSYASNFEWKGYTFTKYKKHEKNMHMFCSNFSARISRNFYQNVLSSARQLRTWKIIQRKKNTIYQVETSTDLWWLWLKIPPENQMKKHVLWIKKRKLYISAFGACSYNDIDMLCDFMREKNASEGTHMTVNHGSRRKVVFFWYILCRIYNALSLDGSPTWLS